METLIHLLTADLVLFLRHLREVVQTEIVLLRGYLQIVWNSVWCVCLQHLIAWSFAERAGFVLLTFIRDYSYFVGLGLAFLQIFNLHQVRIRCSLPLERGNQFIMVGGVPARLNLPLRVPNSDILVRAQSHTRIPTALYIPND